MCLAKQVTLSNTRFAHIKAFGQCVKVVRVPEAFACAVSDSVSGPVSAPSCSGLGSRPWTSSFTVYTNNSIYKGITPERGWKRERERDVTDV